MENWKKLLEEKLDLSHRTRIKDNRELASFLYEKAMDSDDEDALNFMEAAQRLTATNLTRKQNLGSN